MTVKEREIILPSTLRPGWHKFVVTQRTDYSYLQLIQPSDGYTLKRYRADMRTANWETGDSAARASASLATHARLLGGVIGKKGQTLVLWQQLRPGRLWAASSQFAGVVATVTVGGARTDAAIPPSSALAVTDGGITAPAELPPTGVLDIRNTGSQRHNVALLRLKDGKSVADVRAYFEAALSEESGVEDPIDSSAPAIAVGTLGSGERMRLKYGLPVGDYVLLCTQLHWSTQHFHLQDNELAPVTIR